MGRPYMTSPLDLSDYIFFKINGWDSKSLRSSSSRNIRRRTFWTNADRQIIGLRICANGEVHPAELAKEVDQTWDEKKQGYPCFALWVIMGCVRVIMGCVRVVYGLPKTWFCPNMGCVR